MASLGEQLKKAREDAKLSIEKLSERTKIQAKYLKSLEEDQYSDLPSPVYVKGFIQKWADVCNADKDDLLRQFQREYAAPAQKTEQDKLPPLKSPSFVLTSRHLLIVIILGAFASFAGYFYHNQMLLREAPILEVYEPDEFNSISREDTILIEGHADNLDTLYINENEVEVGDDGSFEYNYSLSSGLNTIVIRGVNEGSEENSIEVMRKVLRLE